MAMSDYVVPGSFRDPSGFVFQRKGILLRQINQTYRNHYERLMSSGLYRTLTDRGLLVSHTEVAELPPRAQLAYKVIKPESVSFVSYPYEWCFSQLKDAALATLEIQKLAVQHGMTLKDASAYNILFEGTHPLFIDTLSFEDYVEGKPWIAYRQFCQHFFAPLALCSLKDLRLSRLLSLFPDGIPLDLASRLLPMRSNLKMSVLTHIRLHSKAQRHYQDKGRNPAFKRSVSKMGLLGIIDSLESAIKGMALKKDKTVWGDYYDDTNYSPEAFDSKQRIVDEFITRVFPQTIWDLGSNTGMFSRIAARKGIPTIAFECDPIAIERLYQQCKKDGIEKILPLMMDLTNASPGIGWCNRERMSMIERGPVDLALALAIIHHLAIGNNVPMAGLVEFFSLICRSLIIEFVPKEDSQVQRMLASREDIFDTYNVEAFEREFSRRFKILGSADVKGSLRTLYLMQKDIGP
jgi:hypothetical protein